MRTIALGAAIAGALAAQTFIHAIVGWPQPSTIVASP